MKHVKLAYTKVTNLVTVMIALENILSQFCLIGLVGYLAYQGQLGFGVILAVGNLANQFFSAISELSETNASILSTQAILNKFESITNDTKINRPRIFTKEIRAVQLEYVYPNKQVSFPDMHFEKNKKYLIEGESGSGKTTLIQLLTRSLKHYKGSLQFDGTEYVKLSTVDVLQSVALMSQQTFILNRTIKENICLALPFDQIRFDQVLENSHLNELIATLPQKSDTELDSDHLRLSGGQLQRIAIARAFYHHKDILIFDEGTANLDAKTAKAIEEIVLTTPNQTAIIISHSFKEELKRFIDQTYILT